MVTGLKFERIKTDTFLCYLRRTGAMASLGKKDPKQKTTKTHLKNLIDIHIYGEVHDDAG